MKTVCLTLALLLIPALAFAQFTTKGESYYTGSNPEYTRFNAGPYFDWRLYSGIKASMYRNSEFLWKVEARYAQDMLSDDNRFSIHTGIGLSRMWLHSVSVIDIGPSVFVYNYETDTAKSNLKVFPGFSVNSQAITSVYRNFGFGMEVFLDVNSSQTLGGISLIVSIERKN